MTDINRSVVILKYKQPYLDWVQLEDDEVCQSMTLDELNKDSAAYLVRTVWDPEDEQHMIEDYWEGCGSAIERRLDKRIQR